MWSARRPSSAPAGVGRAPRVSRSKSLVPHMRSSRASRCDADGCEIRSSRAAVPTAPVRVIACTSRRSSTDGNEAIGPAYGNHQASAGYPDGVTTPRIKGMRARSEALALLAGSGVADLALRITQVALPLVILHETGSVAATGLVGGASGVPVLLSPWWARKARQWVDSGPRLAVIAAVQALALATLPVAATLGLLTPGVLVVSGLLLGCGEALSAPGRSALLADTGDRWGEGKAVVLLTWQDGLRRIGMMIGPVIGAFAVSTGLTNGLLWVEAVAVVAAGLLACSVKAERAPEGAATPSIRASLRGRSDVLYGWIVRGTGCVTWFAFTLGLSVIGAQRGEPGVYLAAGMTGYGVGSVIGTVISLAVVRRMPPVPLAGMAWAAMGLCWMGMGLWTHTAVHRPDGHAVGCRRRPRHRRDLRPDHALLGRCRAAGAAVRADGRRQCGEFGRDAGRWADHRGGRSRDHSGRSRVAHHARCAANPGESQADAVRHCGPCPRS